MPAQSLSEFTSKKLFYLWKKNNRPCYRINLSSLNDDLEKISYSEKYVIKVDEQIKGRMKKGLISLDIAKNDIPKWIQGKKEYNNFIVETMVLNVKKEIYLLIRNVEFNTEILISLSGGINVQMDNFFKIVLKFDEKLQEKHLELLIKEHSLLIPTIIDIYNFYSHYHLMFLEINPLAILDNDIIPLDILAKYDDCSKYLLDAQARNLIEEERSNQNITTEEKIIYDLAQKTGSSLKFKLLNPNSRIWFILFGGGASVTYFDKWMKMVLKQKDFSPANYGELSGNPSQDFVYQYTKSIFSLINKSTAKKPFYLIIGGGIANFTLVDTTFKGIINAIDEYSKMFLSKNISIYLRRGGPNDSIGLDLIRKCCTKHSIKCQAYGPEMPMTSILDLVYLAEGNSEIPTIYEKTKIETNHNISEISTNFYSFSADTTCIIYGNQISVAQNMLDFDYYTGRSNPSVLGIIDPSKKSISNVSIFWKNKSILLPIYPNLELALSKHSKTNGIVNLASYRAAYSSTKEALSYPNIQFVSILAEGIAENSIKELISLAVKSNKMLLGPSSIGAIFPGRFRIGNAGGKLDHLLKNRLHQKGCIGIVTRSGGLLNELCYIASSTGFGISSAIAIGGDRFTGTQFESVIKYLENDPNTKLIILLGEVGGTQEIAVGNLVRDGLVKKPIIGLCLGVSTEYLSENIQFGHAGASANTEFETAKYKNSYMSSCGIIVPDTWESIREVLEEHDLTKSSNELIENPPILFEEAIKSGIIRKSPNFFSSITNEKIDDVYYNNISISNIPNLGSTIGNLWFKKNLPDFLTKYFEKILIICADHGPCVSGAQNTIITSRAGKDMISSLCSGLLTIGPKFGGAINEAASSFYDAIQNKMSPSEFVTSIRIISGIGHKHYTIYRPDNRIKILDEYVNKHFSSKSTIEFARSVEKITTSKKPNLILNVDGYIAASLIDGFISSNFSHEEITEILDNAMLNSFFILARTIGLIGHHIDQKRLKQDLYRASEYDVEYI